MTIEYRELAGTPEKTHQFLISMRLAELRSMGVTAQDLMDLALSMGAMPPTPEPPEPPPAGERPDGSMPLPKLRPLPTPIVDIITTRSLIRFDEQLDGGSDTWWFHGGEFGSALSSFVGDTRTDAHLLKQIRYVLVRGQEPTSTGVGYHDVSQLGVICMFLLAKMTPRIWDQIKDLEEQIDWIMHAAAVASAFTTSDHNPNVKAGQHAVGMDGSGTDRGFNPNFRLGMFGQVILGELWARLNGRAGLQADLSHHSHEDFVQQLEPHSLNAWQTYQEDKTPAASIVDATLHQDWAYDGIPSSNPMAIMERLVQATCGKKKVFKGLNDGAGKLDPNGNLGGCFVNADRVAGIPNLGKVGMFDEFDTVDSGGPRCSAHYCGHNLMGLSILCTALAATKTWQAGTRLDLLDLIAIGCEDFAYRVAGEGWLDFMHGKGRDPKDAYVLKDSQGNRLHLAVFDMLQSYHRSVS